jgi:hypothetical protein
LLIGKRNYVLFLLRVFIVQVTKLVEFTKYNTFSKMHFATRVRNGVLLVCTVYSVQCTVYCTVK